MLNFVVHDDCCSEPLSAALDDLQAAGATRWECPKCGAEWRPHPVEIDGRKFDAVQWKPETQILVFGLCRSRK